MLHNSRKKVMALKYDNSIKRKIKRVWRDTKSSEKRQKNKRKKNVLRVYEEKCKCTKTYFIAESS